MLFKHQQLSRWIGIVGGLGLWLHQSASLVVANASPAMSKYPSHPMTLAQNSRSPLADGTYLYGESPQPQQIGSEYLVFRVEQGNVKGAFYLPQSEFNCFSGTLNRQQLSLSVVDPYDQTVHPVAINVQPVSPVANAQGTTELGLEGYHRLETLSENDQRILNHCLDIS